MQKHFHGVLIGISVLPALLIMPAMADVMTSRVRITDGSTVNFNGVTADSINSVGEYGGVIDVSLGRANITGSTFSNNLADVGGVITDDQRYDTGMVIKNSHFNNNHTVWDAGAIGVYKSAEISNSWFKGNTAGLDAEGMVGDPSNSDGGGALLIGGTAYATISNVEFSDNASSNRGGAISGRHTGADEYLVINNKTKFLNNHSGNFGGAIANVYSGIVSVSDSSFSGNSADKAGGAIYNGVDMNYGSNNMSTDHGTVNFNTVTFSGNSALEKGGAIYNDAGGTLNFAGANTFSGNTVNGVANDIHNLGTVNVASGTTTLDGGINGTGTLIVANGATLNIGTASIEQGTITLNGDMLATLRGGDAQIVAGTFDGDGTLKLSLRGADTYHVFGNQKFANYEIESSVYDYEWTNDGKDIVSTMKSVADIASENGLTGETANAIVGMSGSTSEKLNELSLQIQDKLASGSDADKADVERATRAIHPETESVVQSMASAVQNTVTSLAAGRMALPKLGRNGGDVNFTSGGVWAQGIYNKTKQNDAFNGYTRGIAAGIDGTINKVWTIGAGYAFAHSDIAGTARDTEIDSNTIFVYGQYKPTEWYLNATASYTMSDYSENGIALGTPVTADYDVDAYGAKIATGYDFAGGITPEFAARYMHIDSTDYINSFDTKNQLNDADYLTLSLTTKYARNFRTTKGLTLRPELHWGVLYDVLSDEQVATVTMPGVDSYTLNGTRLSRIGGDFGAGLSMNYKNFDLSVNYNIEVREDYTSQTGMVRARINF